LSSRRLGLAGGAPLIRRSELRTWPRLGLDEVAAVHRVLDRGILAGEDAPATRTLEASFAHWIGVRHALLTHSGTGALQLALIGAGIQPGDEVVFPAYGYVAGPMSASMHGAVPRFADVDRETGNLDPSSFAEVVNDRTRAVVPMQIHGCPADMDEISAIASRRGVVVVEDAAQAHGATYRGRSVGALGAMGVFSLHESKPLPAGEGGLFVTDDDALMELALRARSLGRHPRLSDPLSTVPGHMLRGNEMAAALALSQLPRLAARVAAVQKKAALLRAELEGLEGLRLQRLPRDRTSSWYKVRLELDAERAGVAIPPRALRDLLVRALTAEGVDAGLWQHALLPEHPVFSRRAEPAERFGRAAALLDSSVILFSQRRPLIAQSSEVVRRVAAAVREVWGRRRSLLRLA